MGLGPSGYIYLAAPQRRVGLHALLVELHDVGDDPRVPQPLLGGSPHLVGGRRGLVLCVNRGVQTKLTEDGGRDLPRGTCTPAALGT